MNLCRMKIQHDSHCSLCKVLRPTTAHILMINECQVRGKVVMVSDKTCSLIYMKWVFFYDYAMYINVALSQLREIHPGGIIPYNYTFSLYIVIISAVSLEPLETPSLNIPGIPASPTTCLYTSHPCFCIFNQNYCVLSFFLPTLPCPPPPTESFLSVNWCSHVTEVAHTLQSWLYICLVNDT